MTGRGDVAVWRLRLLFVALTTCENNRLTGSCRSECIHRFSRRHAAERAPLMSSLSNIRNVAESAVATSSDPAMRKIADALLELCLYVEEVNTKAERADKESKYASNESRRAMTQARMK
jgi:hypothetical protein